MEHTYIIIFKSGVQIKVVLSRFYATEIQTALEPPINNPACVHGFVIETIAAIIHSHIIC